MGDKNAWITVFVDKALIYGGGDSKRAATLHYVSR